MAAAMEKTDVPGVYKRGGRYVFSYRYRGKQKWASARTKADARRLKAQVETDIERGEYRTGGRLTFEEYATEWLDTYRGRTSRGLSDTTRADYRRSIVTYAVPALGQMKLSEIEPRDVRALVAALDRQGLALGSVRKNIAPLKALFATAVEDGLLKVNPTTAVRVIVERDDDLEDDAPIKAMTRDELRRLLAEIPDDHRDFFELLAHTGCRISEALALRCDDLDRSDEGRPCLQIRRQFYRGKWKRLKTSNGRRDIPLSPAMARRLWQRQGEGEAALFGSATGEHLDAPTISGGAS